MTRWLRSIDRSKDNAAYYTVPGIGAFFRWRLRAAADLLNGERRSRLLDVGYGSGLLLDELRGRADHLFGVDRHCYHGAARQRARAQGLLFHPTRGDVLALPFRGEALDVVFCISLLEHVPDLLHAVNEIRRVLRPNGVLIAGFPPKSRLTALCFKAIGFDYARHHPNSEAAILAALASCFVVDCVVLRPRVAPLYVVTRCTRKE
ncbi:methyltransferase domain-containing protein [Candidatus Fermentibacteria bacterium]|nr:methyltransferase domain-containing protein [Candidatus Fermentibacteria bacterium]